jgi:hypothetical protein
MPRYPLPTKFHGGPWGFGPFLVTTERPQHALVIGQCTLAWTFVAHQMALLLAAIIHDATLFLLRGQAAALRPAGSV